MKMHGIYGISLCSDSLQHIMLFVFPSFANVDSLRLLNSVQHIPAHRQHKFPVSFPVCHVAALSSGSLKQRAFSPVTPEGFLHQPGWCIIPVIPETHFQPLWRSFVVAFLWRTCCVYLRLFHQKVTLGKCFLVKSWFISPPLGLPFVCMFETRNHQIFFPFILLYFTVLTTEWLLHFVFRFERDTQHIFCVLSLVRFLMCL